VVYLVLTRAGFEQVRTGLKASDVVWTGRRVLPPKEADALREQGVDLKLFANDIDLADSAAVAGWTYTVAEHHPSQPIWVERLDDVVAEGRRKERRSPQRWIYPFLLAVLVLLLVFLGAYLAPYFSQLAAWASRLP